MGESARAYRVVVGLIGFTAMAALLVSAAASARPLRGMLDRSFGHNGRAFSDLGGAFASSEFSSMVRQPDGRLLLVATGNVIQRRGPTGSLDASFGSDGMVSAPTGKHGYSVEGLSAQGDGRVLYGLREDPCVVSSTVHRLLPDGSIDQSFGDSGVSAAVPLSIDRIAVDAQGRTLVAGSTLYKGRCGKNAPSWQLAIARVLANGSLDQSFGEGGVVRTHVEGSFEETAVGLVIRDDGTALIATSEPSESSGSLVALTANGALDSSFGNDGVVESAQRPRALLALPGGEAVIAGTRSLRCCPQPGDFLLSRYEANGALNPSFGSGGQVSLDVGAVDEATALGLAPDGSIVLAGGTADAEGCRAGECIFTPILARFTAAGTLEPAIGKGGWTSVEFPGDTRSYGDSPQIAALAISPAGQILAAGSAGRFSDASIVARELDGQTDVGFGSDGSIAEIRMLPSSTEPTGLAITSSGEILASAWTNSGERWGREVLLGFSSSGHPDPDIGSGDSFVPTGTVGGQVRIGGSNRIYMVGREYVAGFDGRGRPDDSYGSNGVARLPVGFVVGSSLARRNGKVLVVGRVAHRSGMAAFQLSPHGLPDRGFGHDGLAFAGFGVKFESEAQSVAVDARGRIVLVGNVGIDGAALRLLPDGRPDTRFGRRGRLGPLPVSGADTTDVALRADGKILIAASPEAATRPGLTSLVRLGRDGARDRSFGRDGVLRVRGRAPLGLSIFASDRQIILLTERGLSGRGFGVVLHAYKANGAVDRRFGQRGVVSATPSGAGFFVPTAAARQPNGRIVVIGSTKKAKGSGTDIELLRFR